MSKDSEEKTKEVFNVLFLEPTAKKRTGNEAGLPSQPGTGVPYL
jgi:hypothetical protein